MHPSKRAVEGNDFPFFKVSHVMKAGILYAGKNHSSFSSTLICKPMDIVLPAL